MSTLTGQTQFKSFHIKGGDLLDNFIIENGKFIGKFQIEGGKISENFIIEGGDFSELYLQDTSIKQVSFVNGTILTIKIGNNSIKSLVFSGESLLIHEIIFRNSTPLQANLLQLKLNKLTFDKVISHKDTIIHVNNISIFEIEFSTYYNMGYIGFNNVKASEVFNPLPALVQKIENEEYKQPVSSFTISNSNLGKTDFINCDLTGFTLKFESSKMTEVFIAGTKMPRQVYSLSENVNNYEQISLAYSQLKKIHENRGDMVRGSFYYAHEMNSYMKTLTWRNCRHWTELLNLWSNQLSNNFGQNWGQAFGVTILVSILLFWGYCSSLGFILGNNQALFWDLLSNFGEFTNPVHKVDFIKLEIVEKIHYTTASRYMDSFSRIVVAYLIFQFIQAFRKHGRRS